MIYCFDIDGTICKTEKNYYKESKPYINIIKKINELYEDGNKIVFFTARGGTSGIDWTDFTKSQLKKWKVKYHELVMNKKPHFDILIDDKCENVERWKKKNLPKVVGFTAGSFDIIHPGYIKMWEDAKNVCNYLIVGLQVDPTIDRPSKNKPVQTIEERMIILKSIKFIDEVVVYETESELYKLIAHIKPDIRILGSDYEGIEYNGKDLNIPVYFHKRDHEWSCTALKNKIKNQGESK